MSRIYCGRAKGGIIAEPGEKGWLGNPIVKGRKCPMCGEIHRDDGSTLDCYRKHLWIRLNTDSKFKTEFLNLNNKEDRLWCFCMREGKEDTCHTAVIKNALQAYRDGKWS